MSLDVERIEECYHRLSVLDARKNEPMREHTSFKIGGAADIFVCPKNADEILLALNTASDLDIPVFCMGNGTNLLVSDDGIEGLVVAMRTKDCEIRIDGTELYANAMSLFSSVAKKSVDAGLMGLEWAAGIPGTVGGACAMNAGAYNGEVKNCLVRVDVIEKRGNGYAKNTYAVKEGDLGYRRSKFAYPEMIVTGVHFHLSPDDGHTRERMDDYTKRRTTKQPLNMPSAGSVFKRPEGHFAGSLIEQAGLKGVCVGGAQVSELHAGFIVNKGGATAKDVLALIQLIKDRVFEMSGVRLEEEVRFVGRKD